MIKGSDLHLLGGVLFVVFMGSIVFQCCLFLVLTPKKKIWGFNIGGGSVLRVVFLSNIEWVTRTKKKANCSFDHSAALTKEAMEHVLRRAPNKQLWESSEKMKDQRVDWENGKFGRMIEEE